MPAPDPATTMRIAADVADAVDPSLTADERLEAVTRAVGVDAELALVMVTSLTEGLIEGLGVQHPDGATGVMRQVRVLLGTTPLD